MPSALRPLPDGELVARRRAVAAALARRGLAGAVVSDPANVRYLGGFALAQPWVSRTRPTACVLAADGALTVVASAAVSLDDPPVDAVVRYGAPAEMPAAVVRALAAADIDGPIGVERGLEHRIGMAVDELDAIAALVRSPLGDASAALWEARLVKSAAEVDRLRAAFAAADRVYARLFAGELVTGETERALVARIGRMLVEEGADEPGWAMVTAGRGAYDRLLSSPRERAIVRGELVWLDIACRVDGYWSDHSRAGVLGAAPTAEQAELQARVVAATRRGVAAVRPGATLGEVATAALLDGEGSPGRIGHGLGLGSSEPPDVVPGSSVVLVPGMVFTIEPLAVRDDGLFQAEAVVAVTAGGCELLTRAPEEISVVGV